MTQQKNSSPVIALLSPNHNAFSETFIAAHKNLLRGMVKFYYGDGIPNALEGFGELYQLKGFEQIRYRVIRHLLRKRYNWAHYFLTRSFIREGVQCVLAEYGLTGVGILPVCKELRIPLIVHFHGFDASVKDILEKYKTDYKRMFDYATHIVVVSKVMGKKLIELGCPESKIVYNVCGPSPSYFDVPVADKKIQFFGVGRFTDKKAPYYTILAFRKVVAQYPAAKLILGGAGELLNVCKNLVRYLHLEKSVEFTGVLTPDEVKQYMSESLAYVQHSITADNGDMEGTPVVILEAQAAGLPVISTKHAGIPDVVLHGETGYLVEEHDVDGMADFMLEILKDPTLAKKLGQNGRARISQNFTMEKHIGVLDKLIEGVV